MKLLYFQDGHASGKNSCNYISNYFEDWLEMYDEILSIAKKNKCEMILDGGDLVDTPMPSYRVLDEIADRAEKNKIPVFSLFGNHASRFHSMEHAQYTGLAHLIKRSEYFNYLDNFKNEEVNIHAIEYSHDVETKIKEDGLMFHGDSNKFKIYVVHAFICPKEFPFATHVVPEDIKTNADLVLVGHYHDQWEKKIGDTTYLGIGCIGRMDISERDIIPTVLLIDTDKREWKKIPLQSAKPAEEIFDLAKVEALKAKSKSIDEFLNSISSVKFKGIRVEDIIKNIATEQKVDKEVLDLIFDKIGETNGL